MPALPGGAISTTNLPPVAPSAEEERITHALVSVFLGFAARVLLVGCAVSVLIQRLTNPEQVERLWGPLLVVLFSLIALLELRRARVLRATLWLVYGVWLAITVVVVLTNHLQSALLSAYPMLLLVSGWLVNKRTAMGIAAATAALLLGLAIGEHLHWFVRYPDTPPLLAFSTHAIVISIATLLVWVGLRLQNSRREQLHRFMQEREAARHALTESEARYRTMIECSPQPVLVHRMGDILYANAAAARLFGAAHAQQLVGMKTSALVHPDFVQAQASRMHSIYRKEHITPMVESRFLKLDGTPIDVEVQGTAIVYGNEDAIHVAIHDITARKLLEQQNRDLAFHDHLTGLPNRRLLWDRMAQQLAMRKRTGCFGAMLFLDLDNFKPLNDTHGHEVGDLLLLQVAQRLRACVREMDTVARFGGDEFVVMVHELDTDLALSQAQALHIAQSICTALGEPYVLTTTTAQGPRQLEHQCSVSIGVVCMGPLDSNHDEVLKQCDAAMYQAKRAGRNQVHLHKDTESDTLHAKIAPCTPTSPPSS